MRMTSICVSALILGGILSMAACGGPGEAENKDKQAADSLDMQLQRQANAIFKVLPEAEINPGLRELGKKLYFETALSINGKLSCNSCHLLDKYGVDNLPTSPGHEGKTGDRNSPTSYNAWFHLAQFWDGRAADLVEQAKGPILNPVEMGMPDEATAVKRIRAIQEYHPLFAEAFPADQDPVSYHNIAVAIAEFEKSLRTPSPFDRYLAGDRNALTPDQKNGLKVFIDKACITCHIGPGIGGSMYQKFGLVKGPYWEYTQSKLQDSGRASVTKNPGDLHFFKVPSLRNVTMTAPYFHDGSVASLEEAVKIMGTIQLGQELSDEEVKAILSFLEALTGEIPAEFNQVNN